MLPGISDRLMNILRTTALMLDQVTATASHTADRQPPTASRMKVEIKGGTDGTGTVTVSGTVDGSPDSEVLTFTQNGTKTTAKLFTALTTFATSGFTGEATVPTIKAQAVDSGGQVQYVREALANAQGIAANLTFRSSGGGGSGAGDWFIDRHGQQVDDQALIAIDYSEAFTPRRGDLIVDAQTETDEAWIIRAVRTIRSLNRPHHWELTCSRFQNENNP